MCVCLCFHRLTDEHGSLVTESERLLEWLDDPTDPHVADVGGVEVWRELYRKLLRHPVCGGE